ncbi:hypothetical protein AVEN_208710-1 [Araneus ventricosus]|uniref:Uncharacterized protein n=1 Tax=Araneus ventricosus TaxID=182803 RepID=A0A4Y2KDM0_ARAVE|nr:hypothetical protein AVEN_208710-1 [Araneus ventricosus]
MSPPTQRHVYILLMRIWCVEPRFAESTGLTFVTESDQSSDSTACRYSADESLLHGISFAKSTVLTESDESSDSMACRYSADEGLLHGTSFCRKHSTHIVR